MNPHRDLVCHRAGRHEETRFEAEQRGGAAFQFVDRRVFAEDIVADFRRHHRGKHSRRRLRYGKYRLRGSIMEDGGRGQESGVMDQFTCFLTSVSASYFSSTCRFSMNQRPSFFS